MTKDFSPTDAAIAAIGADSSDDIVLRPREHAAALPPEASALAGVLRQPDIMADMAVYAENDVQAIRAQRTYKRLGRAAIIFHTFSVLLGALYLLISGLAAPTDGTGAVAQAVRNIAVQVDGRIDWIVTAQILLVSVAAGFAVLLTRGRFYDRWMSARGRAETARVGLFSLVATAEPGEGRTGSIPLLPLQLEYFRRYQLDVQLDYYWIRARQHAEAAARLKGRRAVWTWIGGLVGAPLLVIAVQLGARDAQAQVDQLFAFFGITSSALLAMNDRFRALSNDAANAARYRHTFDNLKTLEQELEPLRDWIDEQGEAARPDFLRFVRQVNRQVSTEHVQWKVLGENGQPDWEAFVEEAADRLRAR